MRTIDLKKNLTNVDGAKRKYLIKVLFFFCTKIQSNIRRFRPAGPVCYEYTGAL